MTDNYSTTLNTGSFKGRCYRHVRVTKPHTKAEVWWVLDDGNHFKSLDALVRFVTVRQIADAANVRAACEAGEPVACPIHKILHGIDN